MRRRSISGPSRLLARRLTEAAAGAEGAHQKSGWLRILV
jgi:hypothetical protein